MNAVGGIRTHLDRAVLFVEMDRPPLNVLDRPMIERLADVIDGAAADSSLCALVLRGAGARAFSAGVDLADHRPEAVSAMLQAIHRAVLALHDAPLVTLAAIRGFCLGGGLELATSCDLVLAEPDATLGQPEVRVGCFPPVACARLASLIGRAAASDMILTGQPISAARAFDLGLVSRLGSLDVLLEETLGHLRGLSRHVLRATLEAMRISDSAALQSRLAENETIYERRLTASFDMNEGIDAFLDKRAPKWRHE